MPNRIVVDVEDRTGTKQGAGPIIHIPEFSHTKRLSRAGAFSFVIPRRDAKASLITSSPGIKKAVIRAYIDGTEKFAGIVEDTETTIDNAGNVFLNVTGRDMAGELAEFPVGFLELADANGDGVTNGPSQVLTEVNTFAPSNWTLDTTDGYATTLGATYARFAGESGLSALIKIAEKHGENFRITTGRRVVWLRTDTPASGVRAIQYAGEPVEAEDNDNICFIQDFSEEKDTFELINRIYPYGAGVGETRLTLKPLARGIASIQGDGAGNITVSTRVNHGLEDGDNVAIEDTTNYDTGTAVVTKVDEDTFTYSGGPTSTVLETSGRVIVTGVVREGHAYNVDRTNNYIQNANSISSLGVTISRYIEFKDIAPTSNTDADVQSAAWMLYEAALNYLRRVDNPNDNRFYRLSVIKLPSGVDIGETIRVIYEDDSYSIDENLIILEITTRISGDGSKTYNLLVAAKSKWPATADEWQASQLEQGRVFSAHPQLNGNSYTTSYRLFVGGDQTNDKAEMRFWFGSEVVQLQQVLFRFNLAPMVSPATTTAGTVASSSFDGDSVETSGPSSASSSGGGSAHSHTIPDHVHQIQIAGTSNTGYPNLRLNTDTNQINRDDDGTGVLIDTYGASGQVTSQDESTHTHGIDHTHDVSIPSHQHTVDVGSALVESFGITRESAANTYVIGDLEYRINSGAWVSLDTATSLGSDWYELDITASVYDGDTFRPVQENNLLEIRRKSAASSAKTAMIDGFLSVRNIIQSIAYN